MHHSVRLYSAEDAVHARNIAADVNGSVVTSMKAITPMLLRVFLNYAAYESILVYVEHYCRCKDRIMLYVRRTVKSGRHGGKVTVFGRFSSQEEARNADVVR